VLQIEKLTTQAEQDWDNYVRKSKRGTFYHQVGWRNAIESAYRCKSHYLIAKENAKIVGILPLFVIGGFPFSRSLVSLPFAPYGGICADNHDVGNELFEAACGLVRREDADYIEFRHLDEANLKLTLRDDFVTLIMELDKDPENLWKQISQKARNKTRNAIKNGLEARFGKQYLRSFYKVYAQNMRILGTPVHSLALFEKLIENFPDSIEIIVVLYSGKVISGAFMSFYKDTANAIWASSLRDYFRYYPNDLLYWERIKYSCEKGCKYFDFGRSKWNSGSFKFKEKWGAKPKQLYYQYYSLKPGNISGLNASDLKARCFIWMWKRVPVFIANSLGPILRRSIP